MNEIMKIAVPNKTGFITKEELSAALSAGGYSSDVGAVLNALRDRISDAQGLSHDE